MIVSPSEKVITELAATAACVLVTVPVIEACVAAWLTSIETGIEPAVPRLACVDLQISQVVEVGRGGGDEVEAAVQQLAALEGRGLGDAVDGFQRGVDLQLVGGDLLVAHGSAVGRLDHEAADVVQQRARLGPARCRPWRSSGWHARVLVIACCVLVMSERSTSLAIKPAGSSLPVLIRRPVLNRVNACCNDWLERANDF